MDKNYNWGIAPLVILDIIKISIPLAFINFNIQNKLYSK